LHSVRRRRLPHALERARRFESSHRVVLPCERRLEVGTGLADIRMPEPLADDLERNPSLEPSGSRFPPEVVPLKDEGTTTAPSMR